MGQRHKKHKAQKARTQRFTGVQRQAPLAASLVWSSPLLDPSGYADEARNFTIGLDRLGVPLRAVPLRWNNRLAELQPDEAAVLERLTRAPIGGQYVHVQHIFPTVFERDARAIATVGRTMFETDRIPTAWVERCNALDEIWVPSDFNLATFAASGVDPAKLRRLPGSLDARRFMGRIAPLSLGPAARGFRFLSIFDWSLRKGWDVLLRAFVEEFAADEDVSLILKVYSSYGQTPSELAEQVRDYAASIAGAGVPTPSIVVLAGTLSDADLLRLYASADAYVMPSRGEGWGRPLMEAMASGLPTIGTNWSGNTEFMHADNAYLIDYELREVAAEAVAEAAHFAGHRWAEPSAPHLRALMRQVFADPERARARGARARQEILERYDRVPVARIAAAHLERLMGSSPVRLPVTWEGSQFVYHSLAKINREVSLGLVKRGTVELSVLPYERDQFDPADDPRLLEVQARVNAPLSRPAAVHVRHQWPPRFDAPPQGAWVMIQPWEFGGLPADWIEPMRERVDEVWVPSTWVRDCYIRSGVPADQVVVIPNGLDLDVYRPDGPRLPLHTRKRFKFLFVGGTIGRKGIDVLVNSYLSTFTADDDVCLVLKAVGTDGVYASSSIESELRRLSETPGAPEIEYISNNLTDRDVAALYRACDVLVHPYRGEGFGMPIAEAMACGLPSIVTGYGAALDFCDAETAYLIPAQLRPLPPGTHKLPRESIGYWLAEPDSAALSALMRQVASDPAAARRVGERARARMQQYGWAAVSDKVLERLQALAMRTPRRFQQQAASPLHLEGRRSVACLYRATWAADEWRGVLASYLRAFSADDDVTLVLCLDPDQGLSQEAVAARVSEALAGCGIAPDRLPDLLLVPDRLDARTLDRLYAAVDWVIPTSQQEQTRAHAAGAGLLTELDTPTWRSIIRRPPPSLALARAA